MGIDRLTSLEVEREAAGTLMLPSSVTLTSREGIAASVRRVASFTCPTTAGALSRATTTVLGGLPGFGEDVAETVPDIVADMTAYGDLLELPVESEDGKHRMLFLGPPSYVARAGGNKAILFGIRGDGAPLVTGDLLPLIDYRHHVRLLRFAERESIDEILGAEGLQAVEADQWLRAPRVESAAEFLDRRISKLQAWGSQGDVELTVIDPHSNPTYYRGRWRSLQPKDSGYFVGRRPQAYGAALWCFVEVGSGEIVKLLDLPIDDPIAPGADEAWRIQAALDASNGTPQSVRSRQSMDSSSVLEFLAAAQLG